MARPCVSVDLARLEHNARALVALCAGHGIAVTGVTKGTCGSPEVARAMLRGGVASLGDARLENARRLREAGITAPLVLLRVPPLSRAEEVVDAVDVSLNSELAVLEALSAAARARGRVHDVVVMVDLGDLREGVWPDDVPAFVRAAAGLDGVRIVGLGTNLTCFGGVAPSESNMARLVERVEETEAILGRPLAWVSGANSSALPLLAAGRLPPRVNHARLGESILLGRETVHHAAWPGLHADAFVLEAEVIELKRKPSLPLGERGEDAFGHRPAFADHGWRWRALLDVGREDVDVEGLTPLAPGLEVLGASSDYLLVDVTAAERKLRVGDRLAFSLGYGALLATMDSGYVEKRFVNASCEEPA